MQSDPTDIQIAKIHKDLGHIAEAMDRNFQDHEEIKKYFKEGLNSKVSKNRFRPTELIAYGMGGGIMFWALTQLLDLIKTAQSFF
jgi:hypothetical protein